MAKTAKNSSSKKNTNSKSGSRSTKSGSSRKSSSTQKKTTSASKTKSKQATIEEIKEYNDNLAFKRGLFLICWVIFSVFLYLCYFGLCSSIGIIITGISFSLFGFTAWIIPILIFFAAILLFANPKDKKIIRWIVSVYLFIFFAKLTIQTLSGSESIVDYYISNHIVHSHFFECLFLSFKDICEFGKAGGGILCKAFSDGLLSLIGMIGAVFVSIAGNILCIAIGFGREITAYLRKRNEYLNEIEEKQRALYEDESVDFEDPDYSLIRRGKKAENALPAGEQSDYEEVAEKPKKKFNFFKLESKNKQENENPEEVINVDLETGEILDNNEPVFKKEIREKFGPDENEIIPEPVVNEPDEGPEMPSDEELNAPVKPAPKKAVKKKAKAPAKPAEDVPELQMNPTVYSDEDYVFPTYDLLNPIPQSATNSNLKNELNEMSTKLVETFKSFGVNVEVENIVSGPSVTRFELKPEIGVKVNKIKSLNDDIMLSLAVKSLRIQAPIPGKSLIGIEIPNATKSPVTFRELIEGDEFKNSKAGIAFAVGKDIYGKIVVTDIEKMPHLLIAGATGSGKSVCINTLIMSLLYKYNPNELKLIMIDPKVVELSVYNGIPHLFCPVVTDAKEAAAALNWAVAEMMKRYNKFKELGVRNIQGYNNKVDKEPGAADAGWEHMCSLVLIVDEFADLMAVASKEVENAVCRIAQLARAAGIHLILATQRPSVDVITGLIKANIPSRIALSTSSAIDSRTIIDRVGAEKLVGHGDMLFFPAGKSEPDRLQGSFLTDEEIERVTDFLKEHNDAPVYDKSVTKVVVDEDTKSKEDNTDSYDEYFEDAARFVIESERASAGQLQRKFKIGFNRAGRILDQLCEAGVVGESQGTKPRTVLLTMDELNLLLGNNEDEEEASAEDEDTVSTENVDMDVDFSEGITSSDTASNDEISSDELFDDSFGAS